jgi:hypothetical protein
LLGYVRRRVNRGVVGTRGRDYVQRENSALECYKGIQRRDDILFPRMKDVGDALQQCLGAVYAVRDICRAAFSGSFT